MGMTSAMEDNYSTIPSQQTSTPIITQNETGNGDAKPEEAAVNVNGAEPEADVQDKVNSTVDKTVRKANSCESNSSCPSPQWGTAD